jgi:hypothetical protein
MDRLKADFIASLPMQPERAAPVLFVLNAPRDERLVRGLGQTAKCYHIRGKREARGVGLWQAERYLRKNFLKGSDRDNFKLVRAASHYPAREHRYRRSELCAMHTP